MNLLKILGFLLLCQGGIWAAPSDMISLPGDLKLYLDSKKISMPIELVNTSDGLEFILSSGKAKDYESMFSTKIKGRDLHFALVSVGFIPKVDLKESDDVGLVGLSLFIQFKGEKKMMPINHYLQWSDGESLKKNQFLFQGSYFRKVNGKKIYEANVSLNLIAAFPSADMVIGPNFKVGNPYENDSKIKPLQPKKSSLPELGTKGELIIMQYKPAVSKK